MVKTKKELCGYVPPTSDLIELNVENAVLMASASSEDINDFEIGYDD